MPQGSIEAEQCWQNSHLQEFGEEVLRPKRLKLGLTQQQMAQRVGIDQSRISRIERGLGKPEDYSTARAFILHYQLSKPQQDEWLHLLFGVTVQNQADLLRGTSLFIPDPQDPSCTGYPEQNFFLEHLLTVHQDYTQRIYQVRLDGNPHLAIEMANFLSAQLRSLVHGLRSSTHQEVLLRLCAKVLFEKGTAYLETALPETVLAAVKPICAEIDEIAEALGRDAAVAGLSEMLLAGAYNINKRYDVGQRFYLQALEHVDIVDYQLRVLRGLAVSATYLHDPKRVMSVTHQARGLIERGQFSNWEQVCETLEGVGRAQGIMGSSSAYDYFDEAERIIHRNGHSPLRTLQLVVSRLEVARHIAPQDMVLLEQIGAQGMHLALERGYRRHANLIKGMLLKVLET
ncbi:MAG: hypothetical protein KatS3mg050_0706 [Litorilinea sp.]|nr:MAG: hypothetical protein KatS3mg050_0706 [Litorilinea sp.]